MNNPFSDDAVGFDLVTLPENAAVLLVEAKAPARLVAHLRLVHDVALRLLDAILQVWPTLWVDREAVLFGAATHDIGKALHPDELYQPGAKHEIDGHRLLVKHGVEERLARFAETHSTWRRDNNSTLEDLLVALADTCWKGRRSEKLEDMVCQQILAQVQAEQWEVFAALDAAIDDLAADGDRRLAWQSQY
jgi:putative nucleotidyltransferase with HDIG domain